SARRSAGARGASAVALAADGAAARTRSRSVRSQHRSTRQPPASDLARRRTLAAHHQDGVRRGLRDRRAGRNRMNAASLPLKRLLPSTMFGRLAAALVIVVGVMLAVIVALILRDRGELSMRVGGVGDSSQRIEYLTRRLAALDRAAR